MPIYNKYEKYLKYINGIPLDEYKQGDLIGIDDYINIEDCEEGAIYRWNNTDKTVCNGYDLCVLQIKLKSLDGGKTWTDTTVTRIGDVIESYSAECGYTPEYDWRPTGKYVCDNGFESEEFVYSYTLDGGKTWEIAQPALYKYEKKILSDKCMMEAEPFSFVYDTNRPGGSLTFYNLIGYWSKPIKSLSYDSYTYRKYYGYTKYIIDWGDGSDLEIFEKQGYIDDLTEPDPVPERVVPLRELGFTVDISSHEYRVPGKYTIKAWGFILDADIIADKINTWGTSGITSYNLPPELFDKDYKPDELYIGDLEGAAYIDGKRFMGEVTLDLIEGFLEPTEENFKIINNYDSIIYSPTNKKGNLSYSRMSGFMSFGLQNSNVTEFDLSNVRILEISLRNLPNLIRTPDFKKLPDTIKYSYFGFYSIVLCPNLKKAGPFSKHYIEALSPSILLEVKGDIDFFLELYRSSPKLEEIDFGYCGFIDRYNYLEKFKNLTTLSGYFYEGGNSLEVGTSRITFRDMFSASKSIKNISNLTIIGGDCTRMFYRTNILSHCKFGSYELLGVTPKYAPTNIIADNMFYGCNVYTVDFSKGLENIESTNGMFTINLSLTTVKGEITNNSKIKSMSGMFSNCSKLTNLPPLFKNYTKELPVTSNLISQTDKLKSIPNDFFNMEGTGYPMETFANSVITNYPTMDGVPIWEWERFKYNGQIARTMCFRSCYYLRDKVPVEWGGGNPDDEVIFTVLGPITLHNPNKVNPGSVLLMYANGIINLDDSVLELTETGTYTIHVRYVEGGDVLIPYYEKELSVTHPVYMSITSFGNINSFYYRNKHFYCYGFKTMGNNSGYYKNLYKTTTKLDLGVFASCTKIIEPSFFLINATNVNEIINLNYHGSYLSTEDKTKLLSPIHNLTNIDYLCRYYPVLSNCNLDGKVTTALNIFKNNPKLISAEYAFSNLSITTLDADEFDNCTELTNIEGVFAHCNLLTNVPTFNGSKKITNFTYAFDGCTNLTGSTPVDENGYKLWERAGKEGYPATIYGYYCFRGCTKLDDYDEIPVNWK